MQESYEIGIHPAHVHIQIKAEFSMRRDLDAYIEQITSVLDNLPEPRMLLIQIEDVKWNIDDIVYGLAASVRGANAYVRHKQVREVLAITSSRTLELAAKGLNSPIFGNLKARIFATLEEAIVYIQSNQSS